MLTEVVSDYKDYRILVKTKQGKVSVETWKKVKELVDKIEDLIKADVQKWEERLKI